MMMVMMMTLMMMMTMTVISWRASCLCSVPVIRSEWALPAVSALSGSHSNGHLQKHTGTHGDHRPTHRPPVRLRDTDSPLHRSAADQTRSIDTGIDRLSCSPRWIRTGAWPAAGSEAPDQRMMTSACESPDPPRVSWSIIYQVNWSPHCSTNQNGALIDQLIIVISWSGPAHR